MTNPKKIDCKNSPLNEVVFGIKFDPKRFNPVNYGLYYNEIKKRFPHASGKVPIPSGQDRINQLNFEQLLPRVWYESEDRKKLIQIQSDRFHYNWRKNVEIDEEYPRFSKLKPEFLNEWNIFQSWTEENKKTINYDVVGLELSYINYIDESLGWGKNSALSDLFKLIDYSSLSSELDVKTHTFRISFGHEGFEGDIVFSLKEGVRKQDKNPILIFELSAFLNEYKAQPSIEDWFSEAHERLVNVFSIVLTDKVKNNWQYQVV